MADRISKEEALSFLLTHLVVERQFPIRLDQSVLFEIMNFALRGTLEINGTDDVAPHEVLEALADEFLKSLATE